MGGWEAGQAAGRPERRNALSGLMPRYTHANAKRIRPPRPRWQGGGRTRSKARSDRDVAVRSPQRVPGGEAGRVTSPAR